MAIKTDLEYVRVIKGSISNVSKTCVIERWKDEATRLAPSVWDKCYQEQVGINLLDLSVTADASKSIADNEVTAAYTALKTLERFAAYIDA